MPAVVFFGSTRIQNLQLRCTCVAVMISFERAGGDMHVVSTYPETDCPTVDNMLCNCGCACVYMYTNLVSQLFLFTVCNLVSS